ncbi:MAG: alkaline phosphatase family protein [Bryobacteraceae bacterium]
MKYISPAILSACIFASTAYAQNGYVPGPRTSNFRHIVVIFQENRTPDNLFYALCSTQACSVTPDNSQYNIQTDGWANMHSGPTNPTPVALANPYDLSHAHSAFTDMCDQDPKTGDCKMDGAINISCGPAKGTVCPTQPQYKYVDNSTGTVQPYLDLATQYGWANYMFQTNQGPSFPAHQFIFGGTSAPSAADDAIGIFAAENMSNTGVSGTEAIAGCIAPIGTTVQLIDSAGVENPGQKIYPCFEHQTIPDVLPPNDTVSWRYYAPSAGSIWTAPDAIEHICRSSGYSGSCDGKEFTANVDLRPADVLTDIGNCQLRDLSWVIPTGANSDHADANDGGGPSWVASIVNAIGNSNCENGAGYWRDTAVIVTWDDWGGWYDHVPPKFLLYPQGGYQLGFRVPLLFISAYTPSHYINNVQHDFGSILRFIEGNFGIEKGVLGFADKRADNDFAAFFDQSKPPRPFKTIATPLDASFFINDKRPPTDPDDE